MEIIVLTLPGAIERQTSISRQMKSLGLNFRFFYGVYGKDLSEEEKKEVFDRDKSLKTIGYEMSVNEIACALGHYRIYKEMSAHKIPEAVVIEDDAVLHEDLPNVVRALEEKRFRSSLLIKLEKEKEFKRNCWRSIPLWGDYTAFRPIQGVYLTTIYYLTLGAAQRLERDAFPLFVPSDFFAYTCRRVEILNVNKSLALQDASQPSLIGARSKRKKGSDSFLAKCATKAFLILKFINPF